MIRAFVLGATALLLVTIPVWAQVPGGGRKANVQTFTASGTWSMPPGVTVVQVIAIGGGGGGGGSALNGSTAGAGGAGGAGIVVVMSW